MRLPRIATDHLRCDRMCGIVGAVGLEAAPTPETSDAILDTIKHRGPDSGGSHFADGSWLGVRRLRILDLRETADQPAVDDTAGVVLVFNGEIYNYVELRSELERHGHVFRTTGDTEVLLRGWIEWQEELFARCNGMWALAIQDRRREGVLLCRDRFGEKPLYVGAAAGGGWWFGSEVAALRRAGAGSGRLNLTRALGFLVLGDVEDPADSYLDGIVQLAPGSLATLTPHGLVGTKTWWDPRAFVQEHWASDPVSDEEVLSRFDRAVELRLRSDVEVGTSLSGGVDSSTVITSIRRLDPDRRIHTFTATFPGDPIDEWPRASLVAEQTNATAHRVEPIATDFVAELDRLLEHQGAPIESPSVYAQWCVMRHARDVGVTVLLDGQGADETWGGYPKYLWFAVADALVRGRPDRAKRLISAWRSHGALPRSNPRQIVALTLPAAARAAAMAAAAAVARRSLGPALREAASADPQGPAHGTPLRRAAEVDAARVVLPRLLRYADRNSMAWSRELRLPFLDPDVVAAGLRSGWGEGLAAGWTKHRLRTAAANRVPAEIVWRREKVAYQTPDSRWLGEPAVAAAVDQATRDLYEHRLLARPELGNLSPWRVLSLARLMSIYDLRAG
jgi:asparagine synthase (glutamine-hydrolysing)